MEVVFGVATDVAAEGTISLLGETKKHIGYLYKYKENLECLEVAAKKLDLERADAIRYRKDTKNKQKDVSSTFANWQSEADKLHLKAQNIISENKISCSLLCSRYCTSKHALELVQEINEHVRHAPNFGNSFRREPHKLGETFDLEDFMEFESRESIVNTVWEALNDEQVRMCSLCGMGGIGKTMLVKKLLQKVEMATELSLFDKIAVVTVSENPTHKKLRRDVLTSLGWKYEPEELETSVKIRECVMNNDERILLILDDVWEVLDFEAIGIPKGKLKILLTSRKEDVCQRMGSEPNFVVEAATDKEAWVLFKKIAMESIEKSPDTARKIANECGGVPLVLVTLAAALKHEEKATWDDSLLKLQRSNLQRISGMEKVYSQIRLSYDLLKDPEAQSCFRLCGLFPEDFNVPLEQLVLFGKGLQLFENVESMKQARDRVGSIISKLKKSFLLLDGDRDGTVKMHDVLRDFAISVSSEDKHPYIVNFMDVMKKWPESSQYENCSAISFICDRIEEHPVDLRCPKLELLQLVLYEEEAVLPIGIFDGSKELKVLMLRVPSLFQSFKMLRKLRSLIIYETSGENEASKLGDLLGDGDLKDLQILQFYTRCVYNEFPQEIGLLSSLRCLEFEGVEFKYMAPGVLSKLTQLEELLLPLTFDRWGCKEEEGERVNASINEIEFLPLTTLKTNITGDSTLAEKLVKNLTKLKLTLDTYGSLSCENAELKVFWVDACDEIGKLIHVLLRNCEKFTLEQVSSLETAMFLQSAEDNWIPKWKHICMIRCEIEYLVDTIAEQIPSSVFSHLETLDISVALRLKDICPFSKIEASCFSNLSSIDINLCFKLKHLFPLSVARELRHLQFMEVSHCEEMVVMFYRDEIDDGNEVVSSITPTPTASNPNTNTDDKPRFICPTPNSFFRCLRGKEKQPKMVSTQQIMEESTAKVRAKQVDHDAIIFPQLKILRVGYLEKLRTLFEGNHTIELPSLENLFIVECNMMEALSYSSFNAPVLEEICINGTRYPEATVVREDLNAVLKKTENDNIEDEEIHQVTN